MSEVVAVMSMSLDGYVAAADGDVMGVFAWYVGSGDVEVRTGGSDPMTFDHLTGTPALGDPTVVQGVGVTHLRYPVLGAGQS